MGNSTTSSRNFPFVRLALGFKSNESTGNAPERLSLIASIGGLAISESRRLSDSFGWQRDVGSINMAQGLKSSIANRLANLVDPGAWMSHVVSDTSSDLDVRLAAAVAPNSFPDIERASVAALAEIFDGHAKIELASTGYLPTRKIVLTHGGTWRDWVVFGRKGKVRLMLNPPGGQGFELSLHQDSGPVIRAIRSGSHVERATPGGRRSLALSFVETCVQEALGQAEPACPIWDYTGTEQPLLCAELPNKATAIRLAQELPRRWPDAFRPVI